MKRQKLPKQDKMASTQRLQVDNEQNRNGNNKKGTNKKRSTRATKAAISSSSDSDGSDTDDTIVGSTSMTSVNLVDALEDVKSSINETVSQKIDSVFEKTKKYMDKTIKPIATRLEKVEKQAIATEDFAKKSVNEILDSHKNIWVSIDQIKKQGSGNKVKPSSDALYKQNNLLISGLELKDGDTPNPRCPSF